jgi:hypothetical protein
MKSRHPLALLGIDSFAGRADEDELFRTHPKFCDRAAVLHGVATGDAQHSRCPCRIEERTFEGGS